MKTGPQSRVDSRSGGFQTTLEPNVARSVWLTLPAGCQFAQVNLVVLPLESDANGLCSIGSNPPTTQSPNVTVNWSEGDTRGQGTSWVWTPDGKTVWLESNRAADFIIDFTGIWI